MEQQVAFQIFVYFFIIHNKKEWCVQKVYSEHDVSNTISSMWSKIIIIDIYATGKNCNRPLLKSS